MPTTTSNFFTLSSIKRLSAEYGPKIFEYFFFKDLIAGLIIFFSSLFAKLLSQCGLRPVIAILAFFLNKEL